MSKTKIISLAPPIIMVINEAFAHPLYSGQKKAAMAQGSFKPGQQIVFEVPQGRATVKIAQAIVYGVLPLRISPAIEQIERRNNALWETLNFDACTRIIKAEGFDNPNDFWHFAHQLDKGQPFQVNQIYFDELNRFYK